MALQSIGLREFRAHLHRYTQQGNEPLVITSHGEAIGYYIPARPASQAQHIVALQEAVAKLSALLEASGVDADTIVSEFQTARRRDPVM